MQGHGHRPRISGARLPACPLCFFLLHLPHPIPSLRILPGILMIAVDISWRACWFGTFSALQQPLPTPPWCAGQPRDLFVTCVAQLPSDFS